MSKLRFHAKASERIHAALVRLYNDRLGELKEKVSAIDRNVEELELRKATAISAFKLATTDLVRRSMEEEAQDCDNQIQKVQTTSERLAIAQHDIDAFCRGRACSFGTPLAFARKPRKYSAFEGVVLAGFRGNSDL
ncbi:MAG: hypothetical protein WDM89_19420 [Rhizomicrobium sp.]